MKKLLAIITLLSAVFIFSACSPKAPNIEISDAWVRPDPLWENAAGYFKITNTGNQEDFLIGIDLNFAENSSLHQSVMEGDIHKMLPVERLEISAGDSVTFAPMGYHSMISGLAEGINYGDIVSVTLEFEISGFIESDAVIRAE